MLNDWFTGDYAERLQTVRRRMRDDGLPLLIRLGDDAISLRGAERRQVRVLSERYHALKSLCHAPIAIYLRLSPASGGTLARPDVQALCDLANELRACDAPETPMRALRDASIAFLELVCTRGHADRERLAAFERQTREPLRACIDLAARDELETLHRHVQAFTAAFTKQDWQAFRVVICASHQPRYRQSAKQYFKRLLHEHEGIEGQVLYGENCRTEADALHLVATHLLDRELADFFLDSPLDLQQDVLGDAAERVVARIFG